MEFVFLSFANKSWYGGKPLIRLRKEVNDLGVFDKIILKDEDFFEQDYLTKYSERFKERGYGYWQWKPYLIRETLKKMNENDILFYCDAGCHLNKNGLQRLLEYKKIVENKSGILVSDTALDERNWTKGDLFAFFGLDIETYTGSQYQSGIVFLRNCEMSRSFVNDWYHILHENHELSTDGVSKSSNYKSFVENRHDQSVLSLLLHTKYKCDSFSAGETWPTRGDYSQLWNYPIWACRNHVREAVWMAKRKRVRHGLKRLINKLFVYLKILKK